VKPLALSEAIAVAIEAYRKAEAESGRFDDWSGPVAARAVELAHLVVEAYDQRQAEYDLLTPYQRVVLARSWREHRRAEVLEQRGGPAAGMPKLAEARQQTLDALTARHLADEQGHLTQAGITLAQTAWKEAGEVDSAEPV